MMVLVLIIQAAKYATRFDYKNKDSKVKDAFKLSMATKFDFRQSDFVGLLFLWKMFQQFLRLGRMQFKGVEVQKPSRGNFC